MQLQRKLTDRNVVRPFLDCPQPQLVTADDSPQMKISIWVDLPSHRLCVHTQEDYVHNQALPYIPASVASLASKQKQRACFLRCRPYWTLSLRPVGATAKHQRSRQKVLGHVHPEQQLSALKSETARIAEDICRPSVQ